MVKASGQIEKELQLLQQRTQEMAEALEPLYEGYLKALGEASKRQLTSAVYHLCTQSYADRFVGLSWQQRNDLQKALQVLSSQIYVQLSEQREQTKKKSRQPQRNDGLAFLQRLLASRASGTVIHASSGSREELRDKLAAIARSESSLDSEDNFSEGSDSEEWEDDVPSAEDDDFEAQFKEISSERIDSDDTVDESATLGSEEFDPEADADEDLDSSESQQGSRFDAGDMDFDVDVPAADERMTLSEEEDLLAALEGLAKRGAKSEETELDEDQPLAPVHLVKQQVLLEKAIQDVFKAVSEATNELLQKADVMPSFPKALMAAASDSHGIGEPINSVPNVVKVSVRVMHGEANLDLDDFEEGRESRRDRSDRHPPSRGRRSRDRSERSSARANRPRERSRSRDRFQESLPPRIIPHEMMEIEALPEFAVVNLQLSEIEFSDPTVSAWRTRVRKELSNLKKLGTRYKKTQRSLETAQAEDAWRASWTAVEDS